MGLFFEAHVRSPSEKLFDYWSLEYRNFGFLTLIPNLDFEKFLMIFIKRMKKFGGILAEIDKIIKSVET